MPRAEISECARAIRAEPAPKSTSPSRAERSSPCVARGRAAATAAAAACGSECVWATRVQRSIGPQATGRAPVGLGVARPEHGELQMLGGFSRGLGEVLERRDHMVALGWGYRSQSLLNGRTASVGDGLHNLSAAIGQA